MTTIKLDATPAGRPLYEQLGFVAQFDFQRWRREELASPGVEDPLTELCHFEEHRDLDRRAFGVDRWEWLQMMASASKIVVEPDGFGMLRRGRMAAYLGPVVAKTPACAEAICTRLAHSISQPIFWDLPRDDESSEDLVRKLGFAPVRVLTRMVLGTDQTKPDLNLQFALCDPASG